MAVRVSPPLPTDWISPALTVIGLAAVGAMVLMTLARRRRARRTTTATRDALESRVARLEIRLTQAEARLAERRPVPAPLTPLIRTVQVKPLPSDPAPDPLRRSVFALADSGHGSLEIARQLDEQVGKVELILALRETPKRRNAETPKPERC